MKRIKQPTCSMCNMFTPVMESELWPSIKFCGPCYSKLTTYFGTRMPELLDGNPLACDLLGLELHGDRYRIWLVEDSSTAREFYFRNRKLTLDIPTDL